MYAHGSSYSYVNIPHTEAKNARSIIKKKNICKNEINENEDFKKMNSNSSSTYKDDMVMSISIFIFVAPSIFS